MCFRRLARERRSSVQLSTESWRNTRVALLRSRDSCSIDKTAVAFTLPLVSPTTFFLLVIQMIGAFQLFSEPFVMTRGQGGPAHATKSLVFYIWESAFKYSQMGKASAIAWVLFAFIFACTLAQNYLQRRWVHYEADS